MEKTLCLSKKLNLSCVLLAVIALVGLLPAFAKSEELAGEGKIFASNYPLAYFAQCISGDQEGVIFPEIKANPAFWKPSVNDILTIQKARVILLNGATYEKWAERVSLPIWRVVDTSTAFRDQYMSLEGTVTHSHGPEGEHSHAITLFTTWLDFSQAAQQAKAVKDALVAAKIGPEAELTRNYEALRQNLLDLDAVLSKMTKGCEGQPLLASHPMYNYLARRYKLNIRTLFLEADRRPDDFMWEAVEYFRRDHLASLMIWESNPLPETIKLLEEKGIRSVVFNPCTTRPAEGDFLTIMRQNVENLKSAFQ